MDLRPEIIVFEIPAKVTEKTFFWSNIILQSQLRWPGLRPEPHIFIFHILEEMDANRGAKR